MFRTFVLFASVIFANADTVQECATYMADMATACASTALPNPPTAASIDGLCSISGLTAVPPVASGCGYEMGRVALKCPTNPQAGAISTQDQSIIDAAMTVAQCCMKDDVIYKAQAMLLNSSAQEASAACWTGSDSTAAFTDAAMATALIPLAVAVATDGNSGSGSSSSSATNNGTSSNATNNANSTAAPTVATASDAGKASLAMSVMAGVAMLRA